MPPQDKNDRLHVFYRDLCLSFAGGLRALTLYPPDHPETKKKMSNLFQRLTKYLSRRPSLTMLFVGGEVVVESVPLHDLSEKLAQVIQRMEAIKFQHIQFNPGVTSDELILFLQVLLPLLKNPEKADLVLAKYRERLPHIIVGALSSDPGQELSYEDLSGALHVARQSVLSFSEKIKDLFQDLRGPLPEAKISMAREAAQSVYHMVETGEIPLKTILYRKGNDPDPYLHAINVTVLSTALAQSLEIEDSTIQDIGLGALLHDIGLHLSLTAPDTESQIITLDERKRQWEHPIRGAEILLASPGIPDLVPMVAYEHHLHYNGGGYPKQDKPRDLNLASLITSITNTYDNLRRKRPGKNALSFTDTLNWMDRQAGAQFHPLLFKKFRALAKAQAQD